MKCYWLKPNCFMGQWINDLLDNIIVLFWFTKTLMILTLINILSVDFIYSVEWEAGSLGGLLIWSQTGYYCATESLVRHIWLRGAMVARLTPDQKAACSNHVGVIKFLSLSYLKKKIFVLITNKHSVWCVTAVIMQKYICLQWGLNSWPLVYKTNALPLSYRGWRHM